jgi:hypothetical protein
LCCGQEPLLVSFSNQQKGKNFNLIVYPIKDDDLEQPWEQNVASLAEEQLNKWGGEKRISWCVLQEARHYVLSVGGTVSYQELQKIVASIY